MKELKERLLKELSEKISTLQKELDRLNIRKDLVEKGVFEPSDQDIDRLVRLAKRARSAQNRANTEIQSIQRRLSIEKMEVQKDIDTEVRLLKEREEGKEEKEKEGNNG